MVIRKSIVCIFILIAFINSASFSSTLTNTNEPPVVPVGLDAYRMWEKLPYQRIGIRAYMRSTYDRSGGNRSADASNFLYQEADDFNVTFDVKGQPGIFYFMRTNHWHGSPWHYEVDGKDMIVKETATADPVNAKKKNKQAEQSSLQASVFIPEDLFPNPLTWTWSITKGADLMWVPIPFEERMRIAYSRTYYGTGYYIYHLMTEGMENLSRSLKSWQKEAPDKEVLELLNKAGTDIAPKGSGVEKYTGKLNLEPFEWTEIEHLSKAPSTVRALKFKVARENAYEFGKARIKITWDNRWYPSVDAPVALFFGAGHLYNSNDREYLVKGFPVNIRYTKDFVELGFYYPMPFFKNAKIEIQGRSEKSLGNIKYEIRTVDLKVPANTVAYFHATYSDHPDPVLGQDITFLDTTKTEGGGNWSGSFVGMSWIFSHNGVLNTLEGDPRFFFDDSKTPQGWGTGTEEWGGGGDYWGGSNMTLPLAGHPVGTYREKIGNDKKKLLNSAYRFLIADFFPFGKNAKINLEHGAVNHKEEHYEGVVYWYGMDKATLIQTDMLNVCNDKSAKAHKYESPTAEQPYTLVSRYEWGPDTGSKSQLFFPAEEDKVRIMKGTSVFKVDILEDNLGVMLRRKFDYSYPNQTAKVYVKPADKGTDWQYAGTWYTAGSNTYYYSYPGGELGKTKPEIKTSNRRWREEEFLVSPQLTKGVKQLAVKLQWVPDNRDLIPGTAFPKESVWSAARYWVYCYKMPKVD